MIPATELVLLLRRRRHACSAWGMVGWLITVSTALGAADPFTENVRPTPWQKPEAEHKSFHLPPGFEIQLVAAEPDINKPLNLAFDARGRLWVTTSIEYPYAAPTNRPGRDRLMIFEDFGRDGRARKVTQFADGLNIPIGIYPFFSASVNKALHHPDAEASNRNVGTRNEPASTNSNASAGPGTWKCIVWSIPNLWLFEDTDGDGKADRREILYGPFDHTRDTHGNQASFRRGFDGWLYCTHGYNNDSHVKGHDGHQVDLNSGNTYRIRLDGSRIEHYTHGQVNPFGLAFDPLGDLFSSDCHSAPIYQLLAGAYYPSFGKPDDGLDFAPTMMLKPRGSTALDGISYYADVLWPEEFRDNIFIGDVMTSRVYRDQAVEEGATKLAQPRPDFVATDDPWFRPVDTQLGPDGALYVADFYNRIIGHYEVPLAHPGRDRTSGRIWRVVRSQSDGATVSPPAPPAEDVDGGGQMPVALWPAFDFSQAPLSELVAALAHPNLTRRLLAMNTIADRFGTNAVSQLLPAARGDWHFRPGDQRAFLVAHSLWLLHRLDALDQATLKTAAQDPDRLVRVHAMRILGQTDAFSPPLRDLALAGLNDADALVQRCAAEALADHPRYENIQPLLALRERVPGKDTHLRYVVRKALRDQLIPEENFRRLAEAGLKPKDIAAIADVAVAVKSPTSAAFLVSHLPELSQNPQTSPPTVNLLKHAARYAPESELPRLAAFARARIPATPGLEQYQELERQFALFKAVDEGLQQRGQAQPESIRAWGTNLVWKFFTALDSYHLWLAIPYEPNPTPVPWDLQVRNSADGRKRRLTSSFPHGERLTGVLRSPDFALPETLSFWLCGHDGFPDQPAGHLNFVRLRSSASGEVLASAPAPRHDVARRITWTLPGHAGKQVYVEAVDGDTGSAYAWLAFGAFEPELAQLRPSEFSPRKMIDWMTAASDTAARTKMKEAAFVLKGFCLPGPNPLIGEADPDLLEAMARSWIALDSGQAVRQLSASLAADKYAPFQRERLAEILAGQNSPGAQEAVLAVLKTSPLRTQEKLANALAGTRFGAETLLAAVESGAASPRVLQRAGTRNRLQAAKPADWESRLAQLTKALPPSDDAHEKLMAQRRAAFATAQTKPDRGREVFAKNCAICHRLAGEGALIGPQLDGIGTRGLERLCEDVLDPNRNVDRAFRTMLLTLKDGDIVSGLFRREEGEVIVLAQSTGQEISIPKKSIVERHESDTSLMPENFGDLLSRDEFNNLMAFLLSKGSVAAAK